jgi:hypothetical protein
MPDLVRKLEPDSYDITAHFWIWFLPSYWYAAGFEFFTSFSLQPTKISGALLTVLVSPLSLWLVIKYFAPSFNQKLSSITGTIEEARSPRTGDAQKPATGFSLAERLARLVTGKGAERMGFLITWKLMGRLRDFKLKVYPSLGYLLVVMVPMFLNRRFSWQDLVTQGSNTRTFMVSLIYASSLLLIMALGQLPYSDKFKAAWFYFTTPINKPGLIFSGSLKAAVIKVYLPIVLFFAIVEIFFIGIGLIPNILLGISNVLLSAQMLSLISFRGFPFSASQEMGQTAGAMIRGFMSLFILIIVGLLHYLVYNMPAVVLICLCLTALGNGLLLIYIKRKSWASILRSYDE